MKTQIDYAKKFMVRGFLFLIPFVITIFTIKTILQVSDAIFVPIASTFLKLYIPDSQITNDFLAPGVSLLAILLMVTAVGAVASWKVGHQGLRLMDHFFLLIPGIRKVHSAGRKVMDMLGDENSTASFKRVVFVPLNSNSSMLSIAFVTGEVQDTGSDTKYLSVIIPLPPNPVTGISAFIKESEVVDSGLSIEEGVQYVMSFGVLTLNKLPFKQTSK